jgi:hypothetical protein
MSLKQPKNTTNEKKEEVSRPFIGSIKIDSKIAFEIFIESLAYDADRQVMEVHPFNSILGLQLVAPYSYIAIGTSDKLEIKMDSPTARQAKPYIPGISYRYGSRTLFS